MQFTQEHDEIRRTLRSIIDKDINPHVDKWEEAGIAQFLEHLVGGEDAVLFPLVDMRIDVLVDDRPQRAANLGVFLGKLHGVS